ncbi:MAG: hypothetical protein K5881_01855 [Saccharofermentans sp.]|nr:hypothetical protein [Saccharofermentans sp.]
MYCLFGCYLFSITGSINACSSILEKWIIPEEKTDTSNIVSELHLEIDSSLAALKLNDGWNEIKYDTGSAAVYSRGDKAQFSLRYSLDDNKIFISFAKEDYLSIKIGLQYGMMLALSSYCIGLHGVTVLCGNEIIILSAPSGTGKTTLSGLLEKYADAIVINGDFALLSPTEEGLIYEPTPFCGSSGRSLNQRIKVNRIVFLEQSKENIWYNLSVRNAVLRLMNNSFVPDWDGDIVQKIQENIYNCINLIPINAFAFAPEKQAADVFIQNLNPAM